MNVIVCLSNNLGMMFNNRRQSRDSKVIEDIATYASSVSMKEYSKILFDGSDLKLTFDENPLLSNTEYCFIEDESLLQKENCIGSLIVYLWNRDYPSDLNLELDLSRYKKESENDFVGTSHEKITKVVYRRIN